MPGREGYVDYVGPRQLSGWACEGAHAVDSFAVTINGVTVPHELEHVYRPDLPEAGFPGESGFVITVDKRFAEGDRIEVFSLSGWKLKNCPWQVGRSGRAYGANARLAAHEDTVIFMHIPKTGGSSVRRFINETGVSRSPLYANEFSDDTWLKTFRSSPPPSIVFGHFCFGIHRVLNLAPRYLTVLRDPLERVISVYRYNLSLGDKSPLYGHGAFHLSLASFVEAGITEETNNHMCRLIAGIATDPGEMITEDWLLHMAKSNIERHFAQIGVLPRLGQFKSYVAQTLGVPAPPETYRVNVTPNSIEHTFSKADILTVEKFNALDMRLYDWVVASHGSRTALAAE